MEAQKDDQVKIAKIAELQLEVDRLKIEHKQARENEGRAVAKLMEAQKDDPAKIAELQLEVRKLQAEMDRLKVRRESGSDQAGSARRLRNSELRSAG